MNQSTLACLLAGLMIAPPSWAQAADPALAELVRCRAIAEPAERLKCYDLIAPRAGMTVPAPAASTAGGSAQAGTGSRPSGAAPEPPATAAASAARFGLEHVLAPGTSEDLRSSIPGPFSGWEAKTRWRLANGQVWQVADGSRAFYRLESPAVRITRGVLGSFFMEIDGVSHAVPVRRLE